MEDTSGTGEKTPTEEKLTTGANLVEKLLGSNGPTNQSDLATIMTELDSIAPGNRRDVVQEIIDFLPKANNCMSPKGDIIQGRIFDEEAKEYLKITQGWNSREVDPRDSEQAAAWASAVRDQAIIVLDEKNRPVTVIGFTTGGPSLVRRSRFYLGYDDNDQITVINWQYDDQNHPTLQPPPTKTLIQNRTNQTAST